MTDLTFDDFKAPGTKFAVIMGTDWSFEIIKRFPEAEILQFANAADVYTAVDAGKVDVGMGFIDAFIRLREIRQQDP